MSAKILVVDDHEIVRHGVRTLLERTRPDWEVCGEAVNGMDAVNAVQRLKPDVVVLDITMPVMNGLEASAAIKHLDLGSRVLIFSMHESQRLIEDVRDAGADGYVLKSHATRDLTDAIESLLAGGTYFHSKGWETGVSKSSS